MNFFIFFFKKKLYKEIELWKKLNHQNIIKLIEIINDEDGDHLNKLYLVMEHANLGQLMDWNSEKKIYEHNKKLDEIFEKHFK